MSWQKKVWLQLIPDLKHLRKMEIKEAKERLMHKGFIMKTSYYKPLNSAWTIGIFSLSMLYRGNRPLCQMGFDRWVRRIQFRKWKLAFFAYDIIYYIHSRWNTFFQTFYTNIKTYGKGKSGIYINPKFSWKFSLFMQYRYQLLLLFLSWDLFQSSIFIMTKEFQIFTLFTHG